MAAVDVSFTDMMDSIFRRSGGMKTPNVVFGHLAETGVLASAKSVLSIGSGTVWADELLISRCIPPTTDGGVSRYVVVHSDPELCKAIGERIKPRFPQVNVSVNHCEFQDWKADVVGEKFDLIFLYEMLYFFSKEDLEYLLRRCVDEFLAPGGHILISIDKSTHESSFYFSVVRKAWPDKADLFIPDSHALEKIFHKMKLNERATIKRLHEYHYETDLQEPLDDAFLSAFTLLNPQRSKEDLERVRHAIVDLAKGKSKIEDNKASILLISLGR